MLSLPLFRPLLHHFCLPHFFFLHFPLPIFLVLLLLFMFLNIFICDSWPQRWNVAGSVQQSPFPDDARRVTWLMQIYIPSPPSPLPPPLPSSPQKHHDHGIPKTSFHRPIGYWRGRRMASMPRWQSCRTASPATANSLPGRTRRSQSRNLRICRATK